MYNSIVNQNSLTFKDLEKEVHNYVNNLGCELIKEALEALDTKLLNARNTKTYRSKGFGHTVIKTIMGNVEINRRKYKYKNEEGKNCTIYLLDKELGMDNIGYCSINLIESIMSNITNLSYRKTAENLERLTGQSLSHTGIWNIVQEFGKRLEEQEDRIIELNSRGEMKGSKEIDVLFQEQDGLWICMQGKDRPKTSKSKKKEIKLGIFYEGFKKRSLMSKEYLVENKNVYASFDTAAKFRQLTEAKISEIYNTDEIVTRIINGDGAKWIKANADADGVHFQLDPFHKSQKVIKSVSDKKEAKEIVKLLHSVKIDEALTKIENIMIRDSSDRKKLLKLEELYNYLVENKDGLIPYKQRKDIKLPKPPEGLEFRNLGTMEHNIADVLASRMKGNKMSWSIKGASNLAKILSKKFSNKLYDEIEGLCRNTRSTEQLSEVVKTVILTASQANRKEKKSRIYPTAKGRFRLEYTSMNPGLKVMKRLMGDLCPSQLIYR